MESDLLSAALGEGTDPLDALVTNLHDVVWIMDMNLVTRYVSPSVTEQVGYTREEFLALPIERRVTPRALADARASLGRALANWKAGARDRKSLTVCVEADHLAKDGRTLRGEVVATLILGPDGSPRGILGVTREIRDREARVEREAMERSVAIMADLAAGLAHRFGNLIAGATGLLSLARLDPGRSDLVEEALASLKKAGELTSLLVALGAGGRGVMVRGRLDGVLADVAARAMSGNRLSIESEDDVPEVEADVGQVANAFEHLVSDARRAEPSGRVTVRFRSFAGEPFTAQPSSRRWFVAEVEDEGPGIGPEERARAFAPWSSESSGAEGLGIAIARSVFASHGGGVELADAPSGGALVRAYLPALEA